MSSSAPLPSAPAHGKHRATGAWIALATTPLVLIAVDLIGEGVLLARGWSLTAMNAVLLPVVFIPLIATIVLARRALRRGSSSAWWAFWLGVILTGIWAVLYVIAVIL